MVEDDVRRWGTDLWFNPPIPPWVGGPCPVPSPRCKSETGTFTVSTGIRTRGSLVTGPVVPTGQVRVVLPRISVAVGVGCPLLTVGTVTVETSSILGLGTGR